MTHTIEPAASGRSKCRGCGSTIAKGELRFGERLPNPFADGDMSIWFHIQCAAYKRPDSFEEVLDQVEDDAEALAAAVALGKQHHRLERIATLGKAPSGRARCRSCQETIVKDAWRIGLSFFEEGMFNASGFIHVACSKDYFETTDIADRLAHFGADLDADELEAATSLLKTT